MKFKKILSFIFLVFFIVVLVGINGWATKPKIENIQFDTGSAVGTWFKIGAGIAEKTNDFFEGFPITATPGSGSVGNPPIVSQGGAHLAMSYGPFLLRAVAGEEPYDKPFTNLRAVAALTPTVVHVFADTEPQVDTVAELIEKKIRITMGVPPTGQGSNYIAQIIFSAMGYKIEDIGEWGSKIYYASGTDLVNAWKDRHTNVIISTYNVPASAIEESLMARKGKILNMGKKLINVLVDEKGFAEYTIPAGTYSVQDNDVVTAALPIVIITRDDVSEEIIYYLTKAIYENKDYMIGVHSSFKEFEPEKMAMGLGIELHKGAEKFYKEVGLIKN